MRVLVLIGILLVSSGPAAERANSDLILGVLEEVAGENQGANIRTVRPVFYKIGAEWQPYKSNCADEACLQSAPSEYPREATWTIAFDGKNLGRVTSRAPKAFAMYWQIGQQEITSTQPVPTVGTRSIEFGGFLDADVYRPLVAVSQPNFKDPEMWKTRLVSPAMLAGLRAAFRRKYPKLCRNHPSDETKLLPYEYKDAEVKTAKNYAANTGWSVARLHLEAIECDDTEAGFGMDDPWFAINPKGVVQYLGSGMWLVDAGDYDDDGKSELLFSISQHNRGGYRIFYDDFRKHAEFAFSYH